MLKYPFLASQSSRLSLFFPFLVSIHVITSTSTMPYDSTITFTLDTICPWYVNLPTLPSLPLTHLLKLPNRTYLAFLRLRRALATHQSTYPSSSDVTFTLVLAPYQLYPDFPSTGTPKYTWYKDERYAGSTSRMDAYISAMNDLGSAEGITFDFLNGVIANTLPAHRVLRYLQTKHGSQVACEALLSLYQSYFEQAAHPASADTLLAACVAAGLSEEEALGLVQDEEQGLVETKMAVREQEGNGVDSVPWVVVEGRKRDFALVGAKTAEEYGKVFRQVERECT
jgi:predicted DsbA family dithiol-disulfide isomerase